MDRYDIKNVELNAAVTKIMETFLDPQEFTNVIASLVAAVTEGKEPTLSKREMTFFDQLYNEAQARAKGWMNRTSNFRENNPRKNASPERGKERPQKRVEPAPEEESEFLKSLREKYGDDPTPEDLRPATFENF